MATKSIILIDFDNIFHALWRLDRETAWRFGAAPTEWLPLLAERHLAIEHRRWLVARCYLNPAGWVSPSDDPKERIYFSRFRPDWVRAGFDVIDCPAMTSAGKNAADIRIVIDALDLLGHRCDYEEFVIGSGDSDFAPLLQRIRANNRRITIFSPSYSSTAYTSVADRILRFDAIDALVRPAAAVAEMAASLESPAPIGEVVPAQAFAAYIRTRYDEAADPLNLAALAQKAARVISGAKESN